MKVANGKLGSPLEAARENVWANSWHPMLAGMEWELRKNACDELRVFVDCNVLRVGTTRAPENWRMTTLGYHGIEGGIGNTPLIKLRRLSELTGCTILGKAEFMNPGGSVKDRAALSIIREAEMSGQLKSGDTIVEGTAGNTGIGLTTIGRARGYRVRSE